MASKIVLSIEGIEKNYIVQGEEGRLRALDGVTFQVTEGETVAIVGPSGCGKTTLLNLVAGFESPDCGKILFGGETVEGPSPKRAVVFQAPALFPWLTVEQNIAYGLKAGSGKGKDIAEQCRMYMELVGLEKFGNFLPHQVSGGMQQRVALARVLILEPGMLLMDEPFAALDAQTRMAMQRLLQSVAGDLKSTILFVTHDVEEALFLADRILVMGRLPGRIVEEIALPFKLREDMQASEQELMMRLKNDIVSMVK